MKNKQAEIVKQMSNKELLFHLYISQIIFLVIAIALSVFLFDNMEEFTSLWSFDLVDIFVLGSLVGLGVVAIDLVLMKYVPKHLMDDGGINEKMFQRRSTPHIFFLALLIATVEELLFRGAIQTHFGIWIASIVFALLHIRYLHKWLLLLSVVLLSFLLGFIYEITGNILVTIWVHFIIDLLLALKIKNDFLNKVSNEEGGEGNEYKEE
ncbi:CPBP family intramembrane glutamic endopeptidase [Sutcliffiella halmapala]|uniref:CPBP family intramembrane glutamic endopeptidase n=1 Tax=Sutcliffiella halmapala TaxID=79882 RepID=UPI0009949A80|nr:type II CAAX endopeptidase family protein [Sutcliffiella halmapala]